MADTQNVTGMAPDRAMGGAVHEWNDLDDEAAVDPDFGSLLEGRDAVMFAVRRFPLSFRDPLLESRFRQYHAARALPHVRMAVVLGVLLYAAFGVLDAYLAPTARGQIWQIRFLLVCPAMIGILVSLSFPFFQRHMQPVLCTGMVIAGCGIIVMELVTPFPIEHFYYAGLILVFMFGYTFVNLRFLWAVLGGVIILLAYEIAAIGFEKTPPLVLLSNNFFILGANLIGMIACYQLEFFNRRDFYWMLLLRHEERKVLEANRRLEAQVAERTWQLVSANEALEKKIAAHRKSQEENIQLVRQLQHTQKLEAIGTLAGGIAHDFNNILSAIMGYSELGLLRLQDNHPSRDHLNQALKACARARELIRQILAFSQHRQEESREPIDVKPVIQEVMGLLLASLPKNIVIRQRIDPEPYRVAVDATQLHQVLMNLCMNAAHAMEPKGGLLDIVVTNVRLTRESMDLFDGVEPGDYLKITVTDTGCGIDPGYKDRIFDPYFTTKERQKGSGMGLAVTFGIVRSHGGAIGCESKVGEGSRFEVVFPKKEKVPVGSLEPAEPVATEGSSILFVDDEAYLVDLVETMLTRLHHRCRAFTDPLKALDALRQAPHGFDLVITDLAMPQMDGRQLAREVAALRPDLPVLLCTGRNEAAGARQSGDGAMDGKRLMKPFTVDELSRAIQGALDGAKGQKTETP